MRSAVAFLLTGLVCCHALVACSHVKTPDLPKTAPEHWHHALAATESKINAPAPDPAHWWRFLGDEQLDTLVESALADNLSLAAAQERLRAARQQLRHADDELLPEIHAHAKTVQSVNATDTYFQYGLDASWELGLFGLRSSVIEQAQGQLQEQLATTQAAQVSLVGEVVRSYLELRHAQQGRQLLSEQITLAQTQVSRLQLRTGLGLSPTNEWRDAQRRALALQGQAVQVDAELDNCAQRLALLLGRDTADAGWLSVVAAPSLTAFRFTAVPRDLLRTRPEIQLAEAQVVQAAGALGIARAQLYPNISLGSNYLYSANITQNRSLRGAVHSTPGIGPNIDIPLFDWGRRLSDVESRNSELSAALLNYRQAVLEGVAEVEMALANLDWSDANIQLARAQGEQEVQATQQQQILKEQGFAGDFQLAEQRLKSLEAEQNLRAADAKRTLAFVALFKAVGGAPLAPETTSLETQIPKIKAPEIKAPEAQARATQAPQAFAQVSP